MLSDRLEIRQKQLKWRQNTYLVDKTRRTWPCQAKRRYDVRMAKRSVPGVWFALGVRMYLFFSPKSAGTWYILSLAKAPKVILRHYRETLHVVRWQILNHKCNITPFPNILFHFGMSLSKRWDSRPRLRVTACVYHVGHCTYPSGYIASSRLILSVILQYTWYCSCIARPHCCVASLL